MGRFELKILWIGKYASEEIFRVMESKGYRDPAAHVSQKNIIKAFDELGIRLDTINAYNVPGKYQDKYVEPVKWSRTGLSEDISVGFRNIKYISHLKITRKLIKAARDWADRNKSEEDIIVMVYGMQSSLLSGSIAVKRKISNSKIYLIVPDLPQYMDTNMSLIKRLLKMIDWIKIKSQMNSIDGYILYTRHMADFLGIRDKRWIEMEGSIDKDDIIDRFCGQKTHNKIIVMYSGNIDRKFGVIQLLDSIKLIKDSNYEFWFSGYGNAVRELQKRAEADKRIKYLGFLPSRKALLKKQKRATMLINMRLPSKKSSAYCFPSKLFEYMASGRPVLSFRIDGIPDEYYKYLVEIRTTQPRDIAFAIKRVGSLSQCERMRIGREAKRFILQNKTAEHQVKRILQFIESN